MRAEIGERTIRQRFPSFQELKKKYEHVYQYKLDTLVDALLEQCLMMLERAMADSNSSARFSIDLHAVDCPQGDAEAVLDEAVRYMRNCDYRAKGTIKGTTFLIEVDLREPMLDIYGFDDQ